MWCLDVHTLVLDSPLTILLLDLATTSLKHTLALFETQSDEVVAYLKRKDAKAIGLGRLVRVIKKEAAWRHAFMHPENIFVHSTRSMPTRLHAYMPTL